MSIGTKFGTDWEQDEIRPVVAAYFRMLENDLGGVPVNKSAVYRTLSAEIGRTRKSVELKFQNISAVLEALEHPWIRGLAPRANYQRALSESIDEHLSNQKRADASAIIAASGIAELQDEFDYSFGSKKPNTNLDYVSVPRMKKAPRILPDHMERLLRKFDPVMRDFRAREIGEAGERLVLENERAKLIQAGEQDLARKVIWVSKELGDGAGYDIKSYDPSGREKLIEVKTTIGSQTAPFFMTRNEKDFAEGADDRYRIVRIFDYRRRPRAFELTAPLDRFVRFEPENYRASFF